MRTARMGLCIGLAAIVLVSCGSLGGGTAPGAASASAAQLGPLVVWRVGGPGGYVPGTSIEPQVAAELRKLGAKVEVRSFPAKGFAQVFFDAMDRQEEPDILVFDNYLILSGGRTEAGEITGITSRAGVSDALISVSESLRDLNWDYGWEYLVSFSRNHAAARAFALREPAIQLSTLGSLKDSPTTVSDVKELAAAASTAYVSGDGSALSGLSDPDRIDDTVFSTTASTVSSVGVAVMTGNDKLAFVQIKCTFEQAHMLGRVTVLTAMRKVEDAWKVLSISADPVSLEQLESARVFTGKLARGGSSSALSPAQILTAEDVFPKATGGERFGNFEWKASSSADLVCEVVEFSYQFGTRLIVLFPKPGAAATASTGMLWTVPGRWTWRVWSIDRFGNVVFSRANHFRQ